LEDEDSMCVDETEEQGTETDDQLAQRPSFLVAVIHVFTMGFAQQNVKHFISQNGAADVAARTKEANVNIGVISAFLCALVLDNFEGASKMKPVFMHDGDSDNMMAWKVYLIFLTLAFMGLAAASITSIVLLLVLSYCPDNLFELWYTHTATCQRVPYLMFVLGTLSFLFSELLIFYFKYDLDVAVIMWCITGVLAVIVILSGGMLIHQLESLKAANDDMPIEPGINQALTKRNASDLKSSMRAALVSCHIHH